jgi:phage FluMu protein Com
MANNVSDLLLGGNAAASLLQHIFVPDITLATIRCAACDCTSAIGSLALYAAPMGAVLKCADCESVLMRAVDTPHGLWLEMTGARYLKFKCQRHSSSAYCSTENLESMAI